jgi:plasmid stability protein
VSGLLIKDLPSDLHRRLQDSARRHHRSMTREALALLESALGLTPQEPQLRTILITEDRKLRRAFPAQTASLRSFIAHEPS